MTVHEREPRQEHLPEIAEIAEGVCEGFTGCTGDRGTSFRGRGRGQLGGAEGSRQAAQQLAHDRRRCGETRHSDQLPSTVSTPQRHQQSYSRHGVERARGPLYGRQQEQEPAGDRR